MRCVLCLTHMSTAFATKYFRSGHTYCESIEGIFVFFVLKETFSETFRGKFVFDGKLDRGIERKFYTWTCD